MWNSSIQSTWKFCSFVQLLYTVIEFFKWAFPYPIPQKKLKQNFALIISFKVWNILYHHALIEILYGGLTWPLHSLLHSTNTICETGICGRVLGLPPHFIPASICAQYDPTHADGSSFLYQEQSRKLGAQVKLLFWYYYCHALITMPTESSTWVQEGTLIPERPKTYQVVKSIWQSSLLHTEITFLCQWHWQSSQRSPQLYLLWSLLKSELNASIICACKQPNQWAEKTTQTKPHRSISFLYTSGGIVKFWEEVAVLSGSGCALTARYFTRHNP